MSVAVIVPVYNTEKYLKRCVDSILRQSFRDFVLLLVDDGSTDSSPFLCDAAAAADPRVQAMHQPNRGLSAARNTGIEEALRRGCEFITFVDSDDWVHSRYLELLVQAMAQEGCGAAVGRFVTTDEEIYMEAFAPSEARSVTPEELYCRHLTVFTVAWGKLFRTCDFATVRFPEGRLYEDEFVLWKLLFGYERVALIDRPIYAYYVRPDSITNSAWSARRLDALDALEEQGEWLRLHAGARVQRKFRQKYTVVCIGCICAMEAIGAEKTLIDACRERLKRQNRRAGLILPFRGYDRIYRVARPKVLRLLSRLRRLRVLHK